MDLQDRLVDFFAMGNIAQGTKETLAVYIQRQAPVGSDRQQRIFMSLSHLEQVREGFHLTLRTASVSSMGELRYLVNRVLFDWDWLEKQGLMLIPDTEVHRVQQQAFAFAHAYVTLAMLPRLPEEEVTFPGRGTYADVPVPRSPGEVLDRIEELESVLQDATVRPPMAVDPEPLRRTYGFFETSAWLVFDHLRLFLRDSS